MLKGFQRKLFWWLWVIILLIFIVTFLVVWHYDSLGENSIADDVYEVLMKPAAVMGDDLMIDFFYLSWPLLSAIYAFLIERILYLVRGSKKAKH